MQWSYPSALIPFILCQSTRQLGKRMPQLFAEAWRNPKPLHCRDKKPRFTERRTSRGFTERIMHYGALKDFLENEFLTLVVGICYFNGEFPAFSQQWDLPKMLLGLWGSVFEGIAYISQKVASISTAKSLIPT